LKESNNVLIVADMNNSVGMEAVEEDYLPFIHADRAMTGPFQAQFKSANMENKMLILTSSK